MTRANILLIPFHVAGNVMIVNRVFVCQMKQIVLSHAKLLYQMLCGTVLRAFLASKHRSCVVRGLWSV